MCWARAVTTCRGDGVIPRGEMLMFGDTVWDARDIDIGVLAAMSAVDENVKDTGDGNSAIAGNYSSSPR